MKRVKISLVLLTIVFLSNLKYNAFSQNWEPLQSGLNHSVRVMYFDSVTNALYVGGSFTYADTIDAHSIAKWNGLNWESLGIGQVGCINACNPVLDITRYKGYLFAVGFFSNMDSVLNTRVIAKWNGTNWLSVSKVVSGIIDGLLVYNNELYVTGRYDSIGGVLANGVAKWDGSNWTGFGMHETDWYISGRAVFYKDELYVGGNFTIGNLNEIARWDGSDWKPVGNGIYGDSWVNALTIYKGDLYVAGYFFKAHGNPGNLIAKWDGNSWSDVGFGFEDFNRQIHDLIVYDNCLWAVGTFSQAGGVPAEYIAKWDGNQWCSLGDTMNNITLALGIYNNELYVGGGFEIIGGDTLNNIAKWTGGSYTDTCGVISTTNEKEGISQKDIVIYPNPFHSAATLSLNFSSFPDKDVSLSIYNLMGEEVKRVMHIKSGRVIIKRGNLPSGMYYYRVRSGHVIGKIGKLMIH